MFDHAMRIRDYLKTRLDVELGRAAQSNIIHVETMQHSMIQQGTVSSSQGQIASALDVAALAALIHEIRSADLLLSGTDRSILNGDLETIEAQLRRPHPTLVIVRESLRSARAALEGAGAALLAAKVAQFLGLLPF